MTGVTLHNALAAEIEEWRREMRVAAKDAGRTKDAADSGYAVGLSRAIFAAGELLAEYPVEAVRDKNVNVTVRNVVRSTVTHKSNAWPAREWHDHSWRCRIAKPIYRLSSRLLRVADRIDRSTRHPRGPAL